MSKLVSVVLPTYNGEKWLAQSIESVLNQTYKNLELIIVNDCSSDGTPEIIEKFTKADSRIKVINNVVNQKLPQSLNIGFGAASGEYWTWTSDDNYYELNAIEEMVNYLEENTEKVLVCSDCMQISVEDNTVKRIVISEKIEDIVSYNCIRACFLYRSKIAKSIGEYDTTKFKVEDYDYFLRMALEGEFGAIHKVLYTYRMHKDSLTRTQAKDEVATKTEELLLKYLPIYKEKFPKIASDLDIQLTIRTMVITKDTSSMKEIWKKSSPKQKKEIYRLLKSLYPIKIKSDQVTECICQISLFYRIKFFIHCKRYHKS